MINMDPNIELPKVPLLKGRQDIILEHCKNKRVLHLGCVDTGLLYERFRQGELMHQKLDAVASKVWGVDVNAEGINFLKEHGFSDLLTGDASNPDDVAPLLNKTFDVIVASEIIEHLQNPGLFLQTVRSLMTPNVTLLIVTVPNAFRIETLLKLLKGVEFIHPDHNYWFSYHTITNLLQKNNYIISHVYAYALGTTNILPTGIGKRFFINPRQVSSQHSITHVSDNIETTASLAFSFQRILSYFMSLPRRFLKVILYSKTPFWGDGIIVFARIKNPSS